MSINVVVSSTAAGVSVSGGTAVDITVGGGIGPAGFVVAPGTATNAFGTFQLTAGDGITISTSAAQFQIASYGTAAVSSLAPVQSVAGRVGSVVLQASDVTAGTFAIGRIPTISYTALANVPATFSPSAHTHSTSDVVSFTSAAAAAAPVQSVAGRTGAVTLAKADVGLDSVDNTADASKPVSTAQAAADAAVQAYAIQRANHSGTQPASTISDFAAEAAKYGPVTSVAGRTGAISLAAVDVAGLASVATSGSYTSLQNVPATFAPSAHTHSTADVVGLTASFSQVGHTHDYAVSVHTHSTTDIVGYTSLPAQGGKAGPLVTDGTAATWSTRYSVVDPVLVQGAGMTLTRDTAVGSITVAFAGGTSGVSVSSDTPQPLGAAAAGSSGQASRADHVHLMPSAADVGAAPSSHSHPYVQVLNGLTGTLSISGGDGVTVSTAASSITIAAAGSFVLPEASASVLGGIKVGSGLSISSGVLSATGGGGSGEDALLRSLFVPPSPTGVTASAGNAQVTVSWTAPTGVISQAPVTDYVVQFQPSGGSWSTFSDGTSTATSATVTGLTNGTAYQFKVAAVNGIGQGAYSSASVAVTPAAGSIVETTAGLYAWYDTAADDTLYSEASGGSLVTTNGGVVNRIRDKSGNNLHLKNFFSGTPATLVTSGQNGKNFVLIDNRSSGVDLRTAQNREDNVFNTGNPLTIFAVWRPFYDGSGVIDDVKYSWGDTEAGSAVRLGLQSGRARMNAYSTVWIESGSGRPNNWICQRATMNGTSSKLYVNGAYQSPLGGGNSSSDSPSGMNFNLPCCDWKTSGYHQFGEVVFYQGALSESTAAAIESFLMTKWGITSEAVSSKLTVTRRNGSPSTFTGAGTAASPFTRAARVLNSNADGLVSASNGTAGGVPAGAYAFTATAGGTAYVTVTFHDDDNDSWVGTVNKNGVGQGGMSLSDGQTFTALSFAVSAGDVITFYSGNTNTSFSNVSVWVV